VSFPKSRLPVDPVKQSAMPSPLRWLAALFFAWVLLASATAEAGEPSYRILSTDTAPIAGLSALAVSEDGSLVAAGTLWGTVQVWDWRRATMISSRKIQHELIQNLFFMDDDRRLTVLYSDDIGEQHMYVWEIATGAVADEDKVQGMGTGYFMPDGTVGVYHGNGIAFMDQKGKYANRYIEFDAYMDSPALSPDGQLIAGGGSTPHYEELVIRDAQGKFLKAIDTGFQPYDTVFSPDSRTVAVLQQENGGLGNPNEFNPRTNGYELFDIATRKRLRRFGGHSLYLSGAQFSPDGSRFLTWSGDGALILWDIDTGEMIHRLEGHRDAVSAGRFLGDGSLIVSSSLDGSMKIWSAATGREIVSMHALGEQTEPPSFVTIQPHGRFFEGGLQRLEIIKMKDGADGPALTREERQALKLQAMEISAD
jgi:WD40 repeat protein